MRQLAAPPAGRTPQRHRGASLLVRSSLEEEFKKHLLQQVNGDPSSSSQAERLKVRSLRESRADGLPPPRILDRVAGRFCAMHAPSSCLLPAFACAVWCVSPLGPGPERGCRSPRRIPLAQDLSAAASGSSSGAPGSSSSSAPPGSSAAPGSSSPPQDPCGEAAGGPAGLGLGGEPYHPLEFFPTSHIDLDWGAARLALPGGGAAAASDRARCFVILFGVGRAETEGIYSLRALAKEDGLPVDTIVAFEAEDDAQR